MTTSWQVLWLGGSSGTGKSTVAHALARRLGVSVLLVDDVRLALQAVTTAQQQPALHAFLSKDSRAYQSSDAFRDGLVAVGDVLAPALRLIAGHHVAAPEAGAVIIEGDALLPCHLAVSIVDTPASTLNKLAKAVFLHEADAGALISNLRARQRGFDDYSAELQAVIAEGSWKYGNYLAAQAREYGLPVVASRPFDTLVERVMDAIV